MNFLYRNLVIALSFIAFSTIGIQKTCTADDKDKIPPVDVRGKGKELVDKEQEQDQTTKYRKVEEKEKKEPSKKEKKREKSSTTKEKKEKGARKDKDPQQRNRDRDRDRDRDRKNDDSSRKSTNDVEWIGNLNFKYEDQNIGKDNIKWHMDQASNLFKAYNNCQGREDGGHSTQRRNVLSASLGIVYKDSESGETYKIAHFPINPIFLDGWQINDTQLPDLREKENKEISKKFNTLKEVYTFDQCKEKGLIDHSYKSERDIDLSFKKEQCHSEKTLLLYLLKNINNILSVLPKDRKIMIYDFILNVASLRDVCAKCRTLFVNEMGDKPIFLNALKERLRNEGFGVQEKASLFVLASGMSEYDNSRKSLPFNLASTDRLSFILQLHPGEKKVYHTMNPYYGVFNKDKKMAELKILKVWE